MPDNIIPKLDSQAVTRRRTSGAPLQGTLKCKLPKSAYADTAEISATVVGDILGKSLENIENLLQFPCGCGEQTMMSFAPNIAIYQYLRASKKLTDDIESRLIKFITAGYINELAYQRKDGSFSAFGANDKSGSTSLTAYVGQYFYLAKDITYIESNVIKKAADFVYSQQQSDGSFKENGKIFNINTQIGSGKEISLTAHCSIFFNLISSDYPEFSKAIKKSFAYLESIISSSLTTYELGIIAYALIIAGSSKADKAFKLFDDKKNEVELQIFWGPTLDVETTSYGLLTYIKRNEKLSTLIKIVKYIISRSNSNGGYQSTQDTVMAIYAISKFAKLYSLNGKVDLNLTPNIGDPFTARVDSSNALTVQSWNLNQNARRLDYIAKSQDSGLAIVSLVCSYYDDPNKVVPSFDVTYKPGNSCKERISFEACAKYIRSGSSGMVIMIVTLPSGYIYNEYESNGNPNIAKTEKSNQESKVTFYFHSISNTRECVKINAQKTQLIDQLRGGEIEVYNYYDPTKQGMISYPVPDITKECYYHSRKYMDY